MLTTPHTSHGASSWPLNSKLLQYETINMEIVTAIRTYLDLNDTLDTPIALLWVTIKEVIRGTFVAISAHHNKDRKDKRQQLEGQVRVLKEQHKRTGSNHVHCQLTVARDGVDIELDRTLNYSSCYLKKGPEKRTLFSTERENNGNSEKAGGNQLIRLENAFVPERISCD
ncbi:hypothetical protein NDU88_004335 [Pleurodeles waltl]|uniref:Uncharacterized protein n=1 Tax=Pleurodeles waltl TaxID=8319 RepID=A0AAV7TSC6_PLEWA|nr:hypothetical protein NDU88_004335 [Pleurodeles waltl]